jgi:hypothetical protein
MRDPAIIASGCALFVADLQTSLLSFPLSYDYLK